MRKIIYAVALLATIVAISPSCSKGKNDNASSVNADSLKNLALSDSLATALAERDTLSALMSDVSDGMNQILDMQKIMSSENFNAEKSDRKALLRQQVTAIQQYVAERVKRLEELETRLQKSTVYSDEMKKQVQSLRKQLENQQNIINSLKNQLAAAHIKIASLNTTVDSLGKVNAETSASYNAEKEKTRQQAETMTNMANEMNVCYYVVGSKSELKRQKIIETGFLRKTKVMEGDYTQSYFTKADKRTLSRIQLHSKKAQVMSKHPNGSYVIEESNGQKVLRITNPAKFWELSNYLVVKVG